MQHLMSDDPAEAVTVDLLRGELSEIRANMVKELFGKNLLIVKMSPRAK